MHRRSHATAPPGRALPRLVAAVSGWVVAGSAMAATPAPVAPAGFTGGRLVVAARALPFIDVQSTVVAAGCDAAGPAGCGGERLAWESLRLKARHALETGRFAAARSAESEALALAAQARDRDRQSANLAALAAYDAVAGDAEAARRHLDAARALEARPSSRRAVQFAQVSAFVLAATGDERQALATIESGLELAARAALPQDAAALLSLRARLEARRGDALHASRDITQATVLAGNRPRPELVRALDLARALLDVATGYKTASIARVEALAADAAEDGATALSTDALEAFADALERVGDAERGRAFRERAAASSAAGPGLLRRFAVARGPTVASTRADASRVDAVPIRGELASSLQAAVRFAIASD